MNRHFLFAALAALIALAASAATPVVHFPMNLSGGATTEALSGQTFAVASACPAFTVASPDGEALRFDGYSNYIAAALPQQPGARQMTLSVVLAVETYPTMTAEAEAEPTYTAICGNLDETARQGFALEISSTGGLRLRFGSEAAKGTVLKLDSSEPLPRGRWLTVAATLDAAANAGTLYIDGRQVGTCRMSRADLRHSAAPFIIGKSPDDLKRGPFLLNTFCGLIDDIAISSSVDVPAAPDAARPKPDFRYPASRYAGSLWRPQWHGMPSGSWTNESHGLARSGGRWHVFFQKNPNGPYMSRLHWGHISSADLLHWNEEPIALAPGEPYDTKGCWSGCIATQADGSHTAIYTAVDNARAVIATATTADATMTDWIKDGIAINGRPAGLSDDFRDPYHFTCDAGEFIIVGSSKGGIGCCTLHKRTADGWTNDGKLFFQGTSAAQHGTFWEMPNITDMGGGRWLFTCTPLNTAAGVRTLCWVGSIADDGTFRPDTVVPQTMEMNGISRDGYGLLSPSICQDGGRTIALGIVPDKLPGERNYEMGWAHCYSLPRELSLDADGNLWQKPLAEAVSGIDHLQADFVIGSDKCGFRFLRSGDSYAELAYNPADNTVSLDLTRLPRVANDNGSYGGIYSATLPVRPAKGSTLRMRLFLDGSIADIFIADRWAFSVRLFPTEAGSATEIFGQQADAIAAVAAGAAEGPCYDLNGLRCDARGLYIQSGKKYVARR